MIRKATMVQVGMKYDARRAPLKVLIRQLVSMSILAGPSATPPEMGCGSVRER
jgi:hypothetical protein